ncbi:hypothetical protein ACOMHN_042141 [Nucella lapillus]
MSEICDKYLHVFDLAVADLYLYQQDLVLEYPNPPGFKLRPLLNSMGQLFNMAEFHQGSVKIYTREVDVLMHIKGSISSDERLRSMMETCYQLACSLVNSGHYEKGEKTHRDIIEGCQKFLEENPDDERMKQLLGQASNGIGVVYVKQRRWEEAIELFDKSMKQHTGQDDKENIASSYINLGMCHMENGDPERGLTDMRKALQMYEELYFGHLPLEVGNLLTNIGLCYRRLDNMEEAEVMYMRSLKVKANAVGWDHDVVAMAYLNLGTLNMHRNDFAKAEEWARKTMTVQEGNGATLDKPEYRMATENLLCCLLTLKKTEDALPIYLPLFRKMVELKDMDRCIPSVHREMAKYLLQTGDPDTAREITLALINCSGRNPQNYVFLDHLQIILPENERPQLPDHCTLDHALQNLWQGNADLTRWVIEKHALPAGDVDRILRLQAVCAENNRQFKAYSYQACAEWCLTGENREAACQVLEAGVKEYPQDVNLRIQLMELYRKANKHNLAYPHLPLIIEERKDDPSAMIVSADIALRSGDSQMALKCFDRVCTLDNPDLEDMAKTAAMNVRKFLAENRGEAGEDDADQDASNPESGEKEQQ